MAIRKFGRQRDRLARHGRCLLEPGLELRRAIRVISDEIAFGDRLAGIGQRIIGIEGDCRVIKRDPGPVAVDAAVDIGVGLEQEVLSRGVLRAPAVSAARSAAPSRLRNCWATASAMLVWMASTSPVGRSKVSDHFSVPSPPSTSWALTRIVDGERRTLPVTMLPTSSRWAAVVASSLRSTSDDVRPMTLRPLIRDSALRTSSARPSEK
ncbi:hypothetical protein H9L13_11720 [Sphingomonas lutea]|uniref:Uncharacterized protein n=1 Tax=Sphingomonas lutea TaxID=1045317 RepID=A0A7G9SHD7_9SPHN|nr:hypothetical protein [Sphingomonas lutea]QNN67262.1 hypothetical protein H9L13_11720 [Sphingomonas lutea]